MQVALGEARAVAAEVMERGYGVVRCALTPSQVAVLAGEVARELAEPSEPALAESGARPVQLEDAASWPAGTQRRVFEAVPPGGAGPWSAVAESPRLRAALDELLGEGGWELPLNRPLPPGGTREDFVRHWYCPVTFPEGRGEKRPVGQPANLQSLALPGNDGTGPPWTAAEDAALAAAVEAGPGWAAAAAAVLPGRNKKMCRERWCPAWTPEEDARLLRCVEGLGGAHAPKKLADAFGGAERTLLQVQARAFHLVAARAAHGVGPGAAQHSQEPDPSSLWTAINRRRSPHRGWHLDAGPGLSTSHHRTAAGHPYQGLVLLVLLSDWPPGGGGTAVVAGSHRQVMARLEAAGPGGIPHDDISRWTQDVTLSEILSGQLQYDRRPSGPPGRVEQVVGRAGDVALLHPLAVHSGTSNHAPAPRLLANGMVRLTAAAFERGGHPLLRPLLGGLPGGEGAGGGGGGEGGGGGGGDSSGVSISRIEEEEAEGRREDEGGARAEPAARDASGCDGRGASVEAVASAALSRVRAMVEREDVCSARPPPDESLPLVSIIVPVHNAEPWLDECLASVLTQTYGGPLEVSAYNDASTDGSAASLRRWAARLRAAGVAVALGGGGDGANGGCGFAKNRAVEVAAGSYLCFLDADDVMLPTRVASQLAAARRFPSALVGCAWERLPVGATAHYAAWANGLGARQMLLEQFRETTVQMPSWFLSRAAWDAVGPFLEGAPGEGPLPEDLDWFLRHMERFDGGGGRGLGERFDGGGDAMSRASAVVGEHRPGPGGGGGSELGPEAGAGSGAGVEVEVGAGAQTEAGAEVEVGRDSGRPEDLVVMSHEHAWHPYGAHHPRSPSDDDVALVRLGPRPALLYRHHAASTSSGIHRRVLFGVRAAAFERRVLSRSPWSAGFVIWGAGRDGRALYSALSPVARGLVRAFVDIDPKLVGTTYHNHHLQEPSTAPVVAPGHPLARPPCVVAVGVRRSAEGAEGALERNVAVLGAEEGRTLWFFC